MAPETGLAIFCGNVSDNPARTDIELFTIFPPEPITISLYRCDSRFFLEPLERTVDNKDTYGMVVLDGRECTLATLRGTNITILRRLNSTAHSKIRKGGQCLAPDTLIQTTEGRILPVSAFVSGEKIKGADLSEFRIGDWECSDKFETKAKKAYRIVVHAPKMEITATAWHRFFTLTEGGVRETYAKDLKIGDRVLVAKHVGHEGHEVQVRYKPEMKIVLDGSAYAHLRAIRREFGWTQEQVAQKLGITQMAVCRMERGEIPLSAEKIRQMHKEYDLELDEGKYAQPILKLPSIYTPKLAYLLGVIAGDGTLDGNRIIIYESYEQMTRKYSQVIKEATGLEAVQREVDKTHQKGSFAKKSYLELRIYSKEFAQFVEQENPQVIASSEERSVPDAVQRSGLDVQRAFLSGLFDAEGYLHGKRVEIAMRSETMMRQVQAMLLRVGIRASCGSKTVPGNPQWCVSISDLESLKNFNKQIGFGRQDKSERLGKIAGRRQAMQFVEQVPADGREVYALARQLGLKTSDFHAASAFFRNKKPLGRATFEKSIAPVMRKRAQEKGMEGQTQKLLQKWLSDDIGVARVAQKIPIDGERPYIDLTVPNAFNFVANGFIVHNSARRFERLIEESIEYYYKRIGEAMDQYFVSGNKGIIVGGPGPAKEDFIKMSPFNYQIKVLGKPIDTGYTDEQGLRELMAKCGDIIHAQEANREKQLIDKFIKEVVSGGLAIYGEANVRAALESKQASMLLISEGLKWKRYHVRLQGGEERFINKRAEEDPPKQTHDGQNCTVLSTVDLADNLIEIADASKTKTEIISTDTSEGAQFFQSFYGMGAFLRYK
ncbi:Peptide chain release factor subunit 1 [uncultured archaeon]|nr:Peptide chain release factor subunit 1 [uncultured archaeon]